jgi:hypothetical protein
MTEEFTGQIYTRMRGRQLIFKIESNQINTTWQIGAPRIDIRPDGRSTTVPAVAIYMEDGTLVVQILSDTEVIVRTVSN